MSETPHSQSTFVPWTFSVQVQEVFPALISSTFVQYYKG